MTQYIDKSALVAEIEKRMQEQHSGYLVCLKDILSFLDTLEVKEVDEEPTSNDLEAEFVLYLKRKFNIPQEGNVLKTNGWKPSPYDILDIAKHFAQWQKNNLWKDAQGKYLPKIDREVIALVLEHGLYKVVFAHRVDENAEVHTSVDGKPLVLHPMRYDKGDWNQPNVKRWLDLDLPKTEE